MATNLHKLSSKGLSVSAFAATEITKTTRSCTLYTLED